MSDNNDQTRRLPLWRSCLDEMRAMGMIHHQAIIPADFLEEKLSCKRNSLRFSLDVSSIRRELESDGFYLSGKGGHGRQFIIIPAAANSDVMGAYSRAALDALKRGVILGTNTRLDLLSESDRRKHEGLLERMAKKFVLVKRSEQAAALIAEHDPRLLEQ
jgi:hypothetical protein